MAKLGNESTLLAVQMYSYYKENGEHFVGRECTKVKPSLTGMVCGTSTL